MSPYSSYQNNQVKGAGPLGLILLSHEALYKSLGRARLAIQAGDMSAEANHTSRAMEALIELSSSLNMEQGGEVARNLSSLYVYMMNRLTEGLCTGSTEKADEVMLLVQKLREGWMNLSAEQSRADQSPMVRQAA